MRRVIIAVLLAVAVCATSLARADDGSIFSKMGGKLARGITNIATGWLEIPKQIYVVGHEEGWVKAVIRGPVDGFGMFGARTLAGAYEILTFPVPLPPQYQPMVRPEYVWQPELAEAAASEFEQATPAP